MAKGSFGPDLRMDLTPLLKGTQELNDKLDRGVAAVFEYYDSNIETHMKTKAPWTDRTSNARNGLRAKAGHVPFRSHWVDLFHSVPYGIWLEVRWSGRYAIVIPTITEYGPKIMATLNKLFTRLGKV